jgi:NTP pyrophosphatase (non-canonical NTP hydrolase)
MSNINDLVERAYKNSVNHGFWEKEKNFGDVISLMHSELSEAYEEYRHKKGYTETYYEEDNKPCGIPSELADTVIRVFDFCGGVGIDLEKIILEKMEYNESRPFKHNKII